MKRIDAVIRREQFGKVKQALEAILCPGMMVFTVIRIRTGEEGVIAV